MQFSEESDSGIVPMNHSNKDGKPLAESAEGGPLIKENARQPKQVLDTEREARVRGWWACGKQQGQLSRATFRRYSSAIGAVCANERPYRSVRGAISDGRPYPDPTSAEQSIYEMS
jgi:hypothetical protein